MNTAKGGKNTGIMKTVNKDKDSPEYFSKFVKVKYHYNKVTGL